jgi:UDP-N-acetyl-D-mannosaminuronic acid dehydrogenase
VALDPWFLVQAAPDEAQLIRTAREVNDTQPARVVEHLGRLAQPPAAVALLGVTYKADVDDIRESPALRVAELAVESGYSVRVCDPHVARAAAPHLPAPLLPIEQAVRDVEAIVLLVDHAAFKDDLDLDLLAALVSRRRVLDTRGVLDGAAWHAHGFEVAVLGNGQVRATERTRAT